MAASHLSACPPAHWPPAPNVLGRLSADQTEFFPAGAALGKTNKQTNKPQKNQKEETKL
jgi:hypothetical protein